MEPPHLQLPIGSSVASAYPTHGVSEAVSSGAFQAGMMSDSLRLHSGQATLHQAQMSEWANYGSQLRAWVGLQVDDHFAQVLPSLLEARMAPLAEAIVELQREATVTSMAQKSLRNDIASLTEERFREKRESDLQLMESKFSTLSSEISSSFSEKLRSASVSFAAEEAESRRQLEKRLNQRLESLEAAAPKEAHSLLAVPAPALPHALKTSVEELQEQVEALAGRFLQMSQEHMASMQQRHHVTEDELREHMQKLERRLEDTKSSLEESLAQQCRALSSASLQKKVEEGPRTSQLDELEHKLRDYIRRTSEDQRSLIASEFANIQQSQLVLVRTELTKAFRAEAAAIASIDQQMKMRVQDAAVFWDSEVANEQFARLKHDGQARSYSSRS